jgi:hypothetical protein
MPEPTHPTTYRAYLLRFWSEPGSAGSRPAWRFSLESVHEGEIHGFSSLEGLMKFIHTAIGDSEPKES